MPRRVLALTSTTAQEAEEKLVTIGILRRDIEAYPIKVGFTRFDLILLIKEVQPSIIYIDSRIILEEAKKWYSIAKDYKLARELGYELFSFGETATAIPGLVHHYTNYKTDSEKAEFRSSP